jgi:hypothetical protein
VGDHTVALQARISSSTSVQEGSATAKALVGKGTMIIETVRATKSNTAGASMGDGAQDGTAGAPAPSADHRQSWGRVKVLYR